MGLLDVRRRKCEGDHFWYAGEEKEQKQQQDPLDASTSHDIPKESHRHRDGEEEAKIVARCLTCAASIFDNPHRYRKPVKAGPKLVDRVMLRDAEGRATAIGHGSGCSDKHGRPEGFKERSHWLKSLAG